MNDRPPCVDGAPLLAAGDPSPVEVLNPAGAAPVVLTCDHGGRRFPRALKFLGLEERHLSRHIVWDIGAAGLTRRLSALIGARAVVAQYSRLVVDLNRPPGDLTSIREISDGVVIEGNRNLSAADVAARMKAIFTPYHRAVAETVARAEDDLGRPVAVVSVHTFTPMLRRGTLRPWHVGVLSNRDRRVADPLIAALDRMDGVVVGDNEPYSGLDLYGYTIEAHALPAGRPNVTLELRQDLVGTEEMQIEWAQRLAPALRAALAAAGASADAVRAGSGP